MRSAQSMACPQRQQFTFSQKRLIGTQREQKGPVVTEIHMAVPPSLRFLLQVSPLCKNNRRDYERCCNRKSGGTPPHQKHLCEILLRRQRSYDRFKSRIAPQRIPKRIETQMAISNMAPWQLGCFGQSFNCAVLFPCPCINDGQVLD
jgi:hypothetical protein